MKLSDLEIYKVIKNYWKDKIYYIVQLSGSKYLEINYHLDWKGVVFNHLMSSGSMRDQLYRQMLIPVGIKEIKSIKYENAPKLVRQAIRESVQ